MKQIIWRKILIILASIISFNGFCISANPQEASVSINENESYITPQKLTSKNLNEISFLKQILIACIPILIGMGAMTLFTFLLTFIKHYSINRLVNLQKNLPSFKDFSEKKI